MAGGSTPKTTTQKVEPWDGAKPYYADLYSAAQNAYNSVDKTGYQGPLYAGPNATQQAALNQYTQTAQALGGQAASPTYNPLSAPGATPLTQLANNTAGGGFLNMREYSPVATAGVNSYLSQAIDAAVNPIQERLLRQVLPGLQDQSIAQGAFGGSGYGTAQGLATSDFTRQALDASSQLSYQAFEAEAQRQQQAALAAQGLNAQNWSQERGYQNGVGNLYGQVLGLGSANQSNQAGQANLGLLPAQLLDKAGSQQQSWDQAAINAALAKYQMNQAAPFTGLGELANILNGGGFQSGTSTQPGASGAASFLQGAAGVAGLGSSLFGGSSGGGGNWLSSLFGGGSSAGSAATANNAAASAQLLGMGS